MRERNRQPACPTWEASPCSDGPSGHGGRGAGRRALGGWLESRPAQGADGRAGRRASGHIIRPRAQRPDGRPDRWLRVGVPQPSEQKRTLSRADSQVIALTGMM
jgi:hypothetical protein